MEYCPVTRYRLHDTGTYDVLDGRRVVFKNACARVTYHRADGEARAVRTTQPRDDVNLSGSDAVVGIELIAARETLQLRVVNASAAPIFLDTLELLDCDTGQGGGIRLAPASELSYLHHGWQSWSPTAVRALTEVERPYDGDDFFAMHLPYGAPAPHERTSNAFMLVGQAGDQDALLLGFESGARQFTQIRCTVHDRVTRVRALAFVDGVRLEPNNALESEPLVILFGAAGEVYDAYARRVAANMGRRGTRASVQGWCSWYYYFNMLTAEDLRANLEVMHAQNLALDLILVDDGYETAIGDWTSVDAEKFPQGMKQIADEIHAVQRMAGIWLAPFGAQENSQLAQQHPEFLLRDENGNALRAWHHWSDPVVALDLTHPGVQAWLRELFRIVGHVWGYDAVKLDFLFAGALAGKHTDPYATRAQAYRRGLEVIAEALGETKIILGCGAPQVASVGLVDSMRVGQDVHISWEPLDPANGGAVSTRHAVQNTLLRAPLNQKWWLNDPDCVIMRTRGDMSLMTRNETRTLASVAALTGSVLLDSDNFCNLKRQALNDLRRLLPPLEHTARVRQWFTSRDTQPAQLELKLDDGRWVLAALNWSKHTRETVVELPDGGTFRVYDFWRNKDLGVHRQRIKIKKHAPHQTVVLHCVPTREKQKPALAHIAGVF
jgi:alpha-galactosidase